MARFIISCGGTGGHLSPGISLAEGLAARGHGTELLVSRKTVDARLLGKYPDLKFQPLPGCGFGWQPLPLVRFGAAQFRAAALCLRLLRRSRADVVVGFGGFTSAPLVVAARILGIPAVLHEANRVPGRAVRTLGRMARRVYLPPEVNIRGLGADVTRHAGLPVRREIRRMDPVAARRELGLDPAGRVLLVLGGSQGSSPLNEWTRMALEALAAEGVQVYCVTGLGKGEATRRELKSRAGTAVVAVFEPFTDRMAVLMSAADLVVSRAGAGTIAELVRCRAPAILVPFPQAADDHQRANAAWFERQGGGVVVPQDRLSELGVRTLALLADAAALPAFRTNLQQMDRADALETMLPDLESIARDHSAGRRPAAAAA